MKKKTVTIHEYQEEFLKENDISPSTLLQEKIDILIGRTAGKKREDELIEAITE